MRRGCVNALISGWQINGILDASSGIPFSVFSGSTRPRSTTPARASRRRSANGVTNRAVFNGSPGIGRCVGPTAASISSRPKSGPCSPPRRPDRPDPNGTCSPVPASSSSIWESSELQLRQQRLEFRTEIFNLLEHRELRRSEHSRDRRCVRHDHRYAGPAADRSVWVEGRLLIE